MSDEVDDLGLLLRKQRQELLQLANELENYLQDILERHMTTCYSFTYRVPNRPYLKYAGQEARYEMDLDTKRDEVSLGFDPAKPMTISEAKGALRDLLGELEAATAADDELWHPKEIGR